MNTQLAIQESDLELVVSEKTLGSLTTNAKQIRDMVKAALPMYDVVIVKLFHSCKHSYFVSVCRFQTTFCEY